MHLKPSPPLRRNRKPNARKFVQAHARKAVRRRQWSTVALGLAAAGSACFGACLGFVLRGSPRAARAPGPSAGGDPSGEGVTKRFSSFEEYAADVLGNTTRPPTPVPVVSSPYRGSAGFDMTLPLATIIGVQKGGTRNLRNHLRTHPLLTGIYGAETHFFDRGINWYPETGRWPGDGREEQLSPDAAASVLFEYSKASMRSVNSSDVRVTVASSPRYILNPLAPYRMKMVQPHARLVLVVRDPTERYFSHLRMLMCSGTSEKSHGQLEESHQTFFHAPGDASGYLKRGGESYEPYTPLCRGENATSDSLASCYKSMLPYQPLTRGLYADQLERWLRVYDRSQILVVESAEMLLDFPGTLARVAEHIRLPVYDFEINRPQQHSSDGGCPGLNRANSPDFFGKGGRYDQMVEEKDVFREWYRPHNQRLFQVLGRDMGWG